MFKDAFHSILIHICSHKQNNVSAVSVGWLYLEYKGPRCSETALFVKMH